MERKTYEKELEKLGAFEISAEMLHMAKKNERGNTYLNAGRGNPNWINTMARRAFSRIQEFGMQESEKVMHHDDFAGTALEVGIYDRFLEFLDGTDKSDAFLHNAFAYCIETLGIEADPLLKELTDAILGNNYPVPSRCLEHIEQILNAFLEKALYNGEKLALQTKVFPTEGGTAAICYIFESLRRNHLIKKGDRIVINTPIFTPYIHIPNLTMYEMVELNLQAKEETNWRMPVEELDVLLNPEVKAFFLVNPSNPGSHALGTEVLERIGEISKLRKDLIIITDDVYGTFVNGFQSVYAVAPYNTLLVYSYSKLYGATGWRVGLIAMNEDNVFDALIHRLPENIQKKFDNDYGIVTTSPRKLPFIERLAADSRAIGLYHTSGLSTPQQAMMALFSLTHLIYGEEDPYVETAKSIVDKRYHALMDSLGIKPDEGRTNSKYYCLIDVYLIAENRHGKEFADYIRNNFEELDFLVRLSKEEGVVLMDGVGFASIPGTLRVSQANLMIKDYQKIASSILRVMDGYYEGYQGSK